MNRSVVLRAVGTGLVVFALLGPVGLTWGFAIAFGLAAGALVLVTGLGLRDDLPHWPPERPPVVRRGSEVSKLSWSFNSSRDEAGAMMVRRLKHTAAHELARHGVDLEDPDHAHRVEVLLGAGSWQLLHALRMTSAEIEHLLDRLDHLTDASTRPGERPNSQRPNSQGPNSQSPNSQGPNSQRPNSQGPSRQSPTTQGVT